MRKIINSTEAIRSYKLYREFKDADLVESYHCFGCDGLPSEVVSFNDTFEIMIVLMTKLVERVRLYQCYLKVSGVIRDAT